MQDLSWLNESAVMVAPRLLGCLLVRELNGHTLTGRIVETEAYNQTDAASHSYKGVTPRTKIMFGPSGHLYVYFTYGMHYCMNIVCGPVGRGEAVLIRAIEPLDGEDAMSDNRGGKIGLQITNGPAKLCQALAINKSQNGHDIRTEPIKLIEQPAVSASNILQTTRIGISRAVNKQWRFYIRGNPYVSKP